MKILYIECNMGAAGDMLMSALSELVQNSGDILSNLCIPSVRYEVKESVKCGIAGTHIDVSVNGEHEHTHVHGGHTHTHHHHTGMAEIESIIAGLDISDSAKKNALDVYRIIAEAEGAAHGRSVDEIHFHEVGAMDAVADIVGACVLMERTGAEKIVVSPVCTGFGHVHCAHGILPVPAPATAHILRGVPTYSGSIEGELCTPTGAALIKHFADEFGGMPVMRVSKIGYGMGHKDFDAANCVRVMIGEADGGTDTVAELCCNLDDMTGEEIGFATSVLLGAGALDVFTSPIGMKKNRTGVLLTCICPEDEREKFARLIFEHTSTIGIRTRSSERYVLKRETKVASTRYGNIRFKVAEGYGVKRVKPEYDDISKAALSHGKSLADIKNDIINDSDKLNNI